MTVDLAVHPNDKTGICALRNLALVHYYSLPDP